MCLMKRLTQDGVRELEKRATEICQAKYKETRMLGKGRTRIKHSKVMRTKTDF